MAMPTAEEIVCLYLNGQKTPPADLKTESLIRAPDTEMDDNSRTKCSVDMNEFMTTGGGRFIKIENFRYVRNFPGGHDDAYVETSLRVKTLIQRCNHA